MWGRRRVRQVEVAVSRFTPTRVGKTSVCSSRIPPSLVHPHACGEDFSMPWIMPSPIGSPPRVWGRRSLTSLASLTPRFTPTRVGKTALDARLVIVQPVHPHACGEDAGVVTFSSPPEGSPPRVWGRHVIMPACHRNLRFTPARVGKTGSFLALSARTRVHPHACGEDAYTVRMPAPISGSPPRVWGRLLGLGGGGLYDRFTPTRVGKTRSDADCV